MAEKYENEEHTLQIKQTMKDLFKPLQEMLVLANFVKIDMVKKRELGVLTSGIKRDGHKTTPRIRKSGN